MGAALVYMARKRNLALSLGTIALQACLTVGLILLVKNMGLSEPYKAAAAALGLMLALGATSLAKATLLGRILGHPVNNWRWPLVWAAAPAVVVGYLATLMPEWLELTVGVPLILLTYGWVIWHRGFGPEDRVLFRRNIGGSDKSDTDAP